ncbi:MAG: septum formation initiator family protein [Bacteroidetes bacterium]|nr:septum formation initiator family protein [Bacteroidota bacterium]
MEDNQTYQEAPKPFLKRGLGMLSWLANKYLITGLAFLAWILFFDPKDIPSNINRAESYHKLQQNEQHLDKMIAETKKDLELLKTNPQTIEKYARENYMMKKDNEDIFIISPGESK